MTKSEKDDSGVPQYPIPDCGKCGAEEAGIHGVPIQVDGGGVKDVNLCDDCLEEVQGGGVDGEG